MLPISLRFAAAFIVAPLLTVALLSSPSDAVPMQGSIKVDERSVYVGDEVKFSGRLGPREKSQRYVLQVRNGSGWARVSSGFTTGGGRFAVRTELDGAAGTYTFRVLGKRRPLVGIPATVTRPITVTITNRPGSRELPWRPGQSFFVGPEWRFTLEVTDTDAFPERKLRNPDAEAPPPGWAYISVPLSFTRLTSATGSGYAWSDVGVRFVGSDGVVYSSFATVSGKEYSCFLADDYIDSPELYPGASGAATKCLPVPISAISGGAWRLGDDFGAEQFITVS